MSDATHILQDAIERNTAVAVAVPMNGLIQSFRTRLLAQDDGTIWLEAAATQAEMLDALILSAEPAAVSFRADKLRIEFSSPITHRLRGFRVNDSLRVEAFGIAFPKTIEAIQRRSSYRVSVATKTDVRFRFWAIAAQADYTLQPDDASEIFVDVRDFANGGMGGIWKKQKSGVASLVAGQRLRIEVKGGKEPLILDGRLSFLLPVPDPDWRRVGAQFTFEATHIVDRQKMAQLGQLLSLLQREELRRTRTAR